MSLNAIPAITFCDHTFATAAENLACEEALLDEAEAGRSPQVLRFWEPATHFVVVGYGNHVDREVNRDFCAQAGIPVFRRCSGGGTVLQGPGILNYSLVLAAVPETPLQSISGTNDYVMSRNRDAITGLLGTEVNLQGHTDLVIAGKKFCGNAQRRRKNYLLFHGSFLLNADIELIEKALKMPSKQPAYREERTHRDFLVNLHRPASEVKTALCQAWNAKEELINLPMRAVTRLAVERYSNNTWNLKFL